jgi:hypothetical protein
LLDNIDGMTIQKLAYTFEEAAEQSGYSVRTLKQAVYDGNLAARYANTKGVIRHEDLAEWLDRLPAEAPAKGSS